MTNVKVIYIKEEQKVYADLDDLFDFIINTIDKNENKEKNEAVGEIANKIMKMKEDAIKNMEN